MENTKTTGNSIQHIFKSLQQFQRSGSWKFVFLFKGKAVFKLCIAKKYKCLGMKTHKLCNSTGYTLQHQSVLGEGQTMPSPTADSSTCHSDTTACGSKGMSSQTAYEEFHLFPSPIWWPDKEKYLLLRDCHYQTVRAWHRTLDRKKLNWMGWCLRKDQGWPDGNIVFVFVYSVFQRSTSGYRTCHYNCGGRREAFMLHQQKVTSLMNKELLWNTNFVRL